MSRPTSSRPIRCATASRRGDSQRSSPRLSASATAHRSATPRSSWTSSPGCPRISGAPASYLVYPDACSAGSSALVRDRPGDGAGFGFLLSWAHFVDPDQIQRMLLLKEPYMWEMFATAVAVAFVALRLLRRARVRSLITGEPVRWTIAKPERRHVVGAAIFGVGWAISDVCPGPLAAPLGRGILWSLPLLVGVGAGIELYLRRAEGPVPRRAREGREAPGLAPVGALPASSPD